MHLTASCTNSAVIISKAVSCEDCFPENTECILKYSKCVPLPYKRSFNPAREFTHQWAPSTDQGKVETETLTNKLISIINIDGDGGKGAFIRCHPASPSPEPEAGTARRMGEDLC
ncbi:hypothetical protein AALO_G00035060 [Alosa alosa]|uniref:Uncharacterized protein n=1 Tax=Alosa alosa TaxID=278164 RepID=A0AAV6H9J9_9TELE|nr:hypothetical protein AALO_G00035060 [Alosa alosa]